MFVNCVAIASIKFYHGIHMVYHVINRFCCKYGPICDMLRNFEMFYSKYAYLVENCRFNDPAFQKIQSFSLVGFTV